MNLIVAVDKDMGIGKNGSLPWYYPKDLNHFRNKTLGHAVIMGRTTWESIPVKYRPLPKRTNIILSKTLTDQSIRDDLLFVSDPETALEKALEVDEAPYIIGGKKVYALYISMVKTIHLTKIHKSYQCDTFFEPSWLEGFECVSSRPENFLTFEVWERV